jgi:hypothetical protein
MLVSMSLELQTQLRNMEVHIIIMHLKKLFDVANKTARCETFKKLFQCKLIESSSINTHVSRMIDNFRN